MVATQTLTNYTFPARELLQESVHLSKVLFFFTVQDLATDRIHYIIFNANKI